jgi:OOP family OmpA-OmpF porin
MRKLMLLLLGAILIGILSYFCFLDKAGGIKDDLLSKTQSVYASKQMDWVKPSIFGDGLEMTRIVTLNGVAPTHALKDEAERIALAQDGVEGVDNRLTVAQVLVEESEVTPPKVEEPKVEIPSPYELRVSKSEDKKVLLSGYVPDSNTHKELVDQANELFGAENVTDELKESEGAPSLWMQSAKLGLSKLADVDYGKYKITDHEFIFKAQVDSIDKKIALSDELKTTLDSSYNGEFAIDAPVPEVVVTEPEPKPVEVFSCQDEFKKILTNNKIHFEYNKADIQADSYDLLDSLTDVAKKCPNDAILIAGHTDSIGSENYNLKLSTNRANAVKEYLVTHGISQDRVKSVGYGESKPIADNNTKEGRSANRRIEFNVMGINDIQEVPQVEEAQVKESEEKSELEEITDIKDVETIVTPTSDERPFSCEAEFKNILANDKVHFDYNKATIASNSYSLLDSIAEIAKKCPNEIISIEGHTDSIGSKSYNLKLSLNRVNAVKDYLVKRGVKADRLEVVGHGESKPLVSNMLKAGRAKNRRIEFIVKGVR